MDIIKSSDGTYSFPGMEVYGVGTVRILRHAAVIGRTLDTPLHVNAACRALGFAPGERVIVADQYGQCRTVTVAAHVHTGFEMGAL